MNFQDFRDSLNFDIAPQSYSAYLLALWYDGKGDWKSAHEIAQDISGWEGSWIHAFLHRKEGEQWNANYWYQRAGKPMPSISLDKEWQELVEFFIHYGDRYSGDQENENKL